jgi:hypothetical protein
MSTLNQHISNLRGLIRKHNRNDDVYTDQFLYELLKGCRAEFLKQQLNKLQNVNSWNYQRFNIDLELVTDYVCNSVCGTKTLKSKIKIPRPLRSVLRDEVVFFTLGQKEITLVSPDKWQIYKHDEIKSKGYIGSIVNNYLYIWNDQNLICVTAYGLWEDPTEWTECCDDDVPCYNIETAEFPMDEDIKITVYLQVLKALSITLQLPADVTNNNTEAI